MLNVWFALIQVDFVIGLCPSVDSNVIYCFRITYREVNTDLR